jgi:hypothetical protein
MGRWTDRRIDRSETNRQTDRQNKRIDRQIGRHADRHTNKRIERQTLKKTQVRGSVSSLSCGCINLVDENHKGSFFYFLFQSKKNSSFGGKIVFIQA